MSKSFRTWVCLPLLAIGLSMNVNGSALAQDYTKTDVTGRISLPHNLPAIGAKVVLRNVSTGTIYGALADSTGMYRVPQVETGGPYRIEASLKGYLDGIRQNIYLSSGKQNPVNLELEEIREKKPAERRKRIPAVDSLKKPDQENLSPE